jgi:hypothetical protein
MKNAGSVKTPAMEIVDQALADWLERYREIV